MRDKDQGYCSPELQDLGTLTELTLGGNVQGFEDAGPKFSILDVSPAATP